MKVARCEHQVSLPGHDESSCAGPPHVRPIDNYLIVQMMFFTCCVNIQLVLLQTAQLGLLGRCLLAVPLSQRLDSGKLFLQRHNRQLNIPAIHSAAASRIDSGASTADNRATTSVRHGFPAVYCGWGRRMG